MKQQRLAAIAGAIVVASVSAVPAAAKCSHGPAAGVDWQGCRKGNLMLRGYDLSGAQLTKSELSRNDMTGTKLEGADFTRAMMFRITLKKADLRNAVLRKVEASRSNLAGADLSNADLAKSEFHRSDFSGSRLDGADMSRAEFSRADFSDAVLKDVDLSLSNISRARMNGLVFDNVDLTRAYMYSTFIEGADLTRTTGLVQEQIDLSCGDAGTKLPEPLKAPESWPCPKDD